MKKIAFCFLTYKNLNQPQLWKQFFINNNQYNIYIHNKEDFTGDFSEYIISNKIDTKWGTISLVKATLLLFEEAFKNEENEYFMLLSDACIPLHNFNTIYKKVLELDSSIINLFEKHNNDMIKQHQWILLKRDLLEWYINNKHFEEFQNFIPPDEYYFINLYNQFNLKNKYKLIEHPLTYVNWKDLSTNPKYRITPKTYDNLDNIKEDYLFMRKISDICVFKYDFICNINYPLINIINKWTTDKIYWLQLDTKASQKASLLGTIAFFDKYNLNYEKIEYENINTLDDNSYIVISGNYNNDNFNKKIIVLQEKFNILLLPHTNLNKFLIKKFNKNIFTVAKDEKTYQFYKNNNIIHNYLSFDMGFYIDISNLKNKFVDKENEIIKTKELNIIIYSILLDKKCNIVSQNHNLNNDYYNYFFKLIQNINLLKK